MEDAANDLAVFEHVVIVLTPTRGIAALEDQRGHFGGGGGGGGLGGLGGGGLGLASITATPRAGVQHEKGWPGLRGRDQTDAAAAPLPSREKERVRVSLGDVGGRAL